MTCDVDPGDSVRAGQSVARVIDDTRHVRFALPREHLPSAGSLAVLLTVDTGAPAGSARPTIAGIVDSLQPEVDPAAQLVFATVTPSGDSSTLMPGTRVEVSPALAEPGAGLEGR